MINHIVYVPKFGRDTFSGMELNAIAGIQQAGAEYSIPVSSWSERNQAETSTKCLYISLGGDGTMLTAMRAASSHNNGSVFGVNFGHLGFLTTVDGSKYLTADSFKKLFEGVIRQPWNWAFDRRMVIQGDVHGNNCPPSSAINEVLITTPTRRNPLTCDIYINDKFVASVSGDGVIVSTATGSTAYAMSAGGSIMSPNARAMQIVPLSAHTLTSRPIVVSENDKVRIVASKDQRADIVEVLNDGQQVFTSEMSDLEEDFMMTISKKNFVDIYRPVDWNFFNVLSEKMGWGR